MSPYDRLLKKIEVNRTSGCWEFVTAPSQKYAYIRVEDRKLKAHRFMYEYKHGPIPEGFVVMHTCHNRKCVNYAHLKVGTQQENVLGSVAVGRHAAGRVGKSGIKGVRQIKKAWLAEYWNGERPVILYYGHDFFEACCARKSWEARKTLLNAPQNLLDSSPGIGHTRDPRSLLTEALP